MFQVTPRDALRFTKLCVCFIFTWPPWPEANNIVKLLFNFFSWSSIIFPTLLGIALLNAARYQLDDYLALTKSLCLAFSCLQLVIKILVCKGHRSRLEMIHCSVKDFIENATAREMALLQRYVNRCAPMHFIVNVFALVAGLAMISGPFLLPINLPSDAKYPFDVDKHPGWDVAYLHHVVAGMQCASITPIECHAAVLIWFAGARLELLSEEFQNVTSIQEFNECIKKHQILLKKTDEMIEIVRLIVVTSTLMAGLSIVTGAIHIISHEAMVIKFQFIVIDGGFALILFISAWPAENLINFSNEIGQGAYNSPWIQNRPEMRKNVLFVLQRSQMQCSISVPGILPEHSLRYYTAFLSKTFSFFTTLRIVFDDSNN
uniref:Odorant receptor n=1 Tax=Campoletis chlorideae TaxID=219166 RepID=A0A346D444_9HYME|nr:odorant receptor [Campoletis chlorideae]